MAGETAHQAGQVLPIHVAQERSVTLGACWCYGILPALCGVLSFFIENITVQLNMYETLSP